ncbi:MAG TPA: ATP-binding protein, partial [Armatimonadota bacterium]|nr:ATP-binding protein [Armatimonadota bacterium]
IGIPLLAFAWLLSSLLWGFYLQQLEGELGSKALVIADSVARILSPRTPDDDARLGHIVDRWKRYSAMRVYVVDSEGVIRAATLPQDIGERVREERRPGLLKALQGEIAATTWKSPNFGYEDTMYVNVPVKEDGRVVGAVRVAYTLTQIQQNVARIRAALLLSGAAYALLIVVLTVWIAGTIARPVEQLNEGAQRLAAGDLAYRVQVDGTQEVTQLAETLNRMSARLEQLEGMRRQYVSNASHELRTPLAAIRGMAETLLQYGEQDPSLAQRYLPRIISQADRLARLASQFLDLAQIESGNLIHSLEPVSVVGVVDEVVQTLTERAAEQQVELRTELEDGLPELLADRDRLVQVLVNLLDNALRYTPQGGVVEVSARRAGSDLLLEVADTGAGISEEHLPHLFERFYRVDRARGAATGGTGLGLSIVQQIVEAHGGHIEARSRVGKGTRFTITLPIRRPEEQPAVTLAAFSR